MVKVLKVKVRNCAALVPSTMDTILSTENKNKINDFIGSRTTTVDGKNILIPFLEIFQNLIGTIETKFDEFKCEMLDAYKAKDDRIETLNATVATQKNLIQTLENNLDEQAQYARRESLVFSGDQLPKPSDGEDCIEIVCNLVNQKLSGAGLQLSHAEISVALRLGPKPREGADRRSIIARFIRRTHKYKVLKEARRSKPERLYVNESLTPLRQTIIRVLGRAKFEFPGKISGYLTTDGSIQAWVKPPNPTAEGARNSRVTINTQGKLEEFCQKTFERPVAHFLAAKARHGRPT